MPWGKKPKTDDELKTLYTEMYNTGVEYCNLFSGEHAPKDPDDFPHQEKLEKHMGFKRHVKELMGKIAGQITDLDVAVRKY